MRLNFFKLARATCVALMVTYCSISAAGQGVVTLKKQKIRASELIKIINKQTGYNILYSNQIFNDKKILNVEFDEADIHKVMNTLLDQSGLQYKIKDNTILINQITQTEEASSLKNANSFQQGVSGKISDDKGEPLQGASVSIKGTNIGISTDAEGRFTLAQAKVNDVLEIRFVGYQAKSYTITSTAQPIELSLAAEDNMLDAVVVTALGIKRSEKALSYNVQQVKEDDLTRVKDVNFINALSGKVAGVTINSSSSGIGGASKVVMRGSKAIDQTNNTLYVIDGIPIHNYSGEEGKEFSSSGTSESIADINPEDIESMSVLTGAAAAALYGSRAANGAIVINTKKGKIGKTTLSLSQNTEILDAFVLPKFQNRFGTGSGLFQNTNDRSWGKPLNSSNFMGYSPDKDYFKTGVIATENISFSTGNEKNQTYVSAAAVNSEGIIPNNKYDRYNFTFRNTSKFLNDKMTLDVGGSYIKQQDQNMTNQGTYSNPLVTAYLFPRGDDWNDIKMYERYDTQRKIYTQYWPQGLNEFTGQNPYWINYRNLRNNSKDRYMLNANLEYKVLDWLSLAARVRIDNADTEYSERLYASTNTTLAEGSENGLYGIKEIKDKQLYTDFMANINKTFNDFSLQANVGAILTDARQNFIQNRGPIRPNGIPNKFNIAQLDYENTKHRDEGWRDQTQSIFASAELGYKGAYYLTLTGRNDWASQLAGPKSKATSFFYPSVGTSIILSEIFSMPEEIEYLKLRGSFASIGLPFPRFIANPVYDWDETIQQYKDKTNYPMTDLKPERTDSWELGISTRFLKGFNLDLSVYDTKTYNQTFDPKISVSSMYTTLYVQTGSVRNRGIELGLGYQKQWGDVNWASNYTFSANRNKILELVRNYQHPETGAIINKDRLDVGGLSQARFILKEGGTLGDMYSLSDLQRDSNGDIYIDQDGRVAVNNKAGDIKLGSIFPKANMAWRNDFSWKNFRAGFMFSARLGGIVYSATQAALDQYGVSEASAVARENGGVMLNGGDLVDAETWYTTIGGKSGLPQYYAYSATNVRLQEASIGYTIPKNRFWNLGEVSLTLVGRNLWMIYNKAPYDPESTASTGNYYQGIDNFMTPSTRNIGVNVRLKF
ncbi:SusC/RagA family TonB-linked outer membrane protein [Sphingobacterium spiritivorum]|uniref:SusC/RagA family TonB-linked outer membrane protein n=1 Tax=Sphingobacterium spiritivorum TaxID=258 RepID=UPI003DA5B14D